MEYALFRAEVMCRYDFAPVRPIQYNCMFSAQGRHAHKNLQLRQISMTAICLWSGPRNVSTALMYSFAQRGDTRVVDEPLYGHFLRVTGTVHPGREEVLASVNCDGDEVMRKLLADPGSWGRDVLFMKQMAHHLVGVNQSFLSDTRNVFLVRDPQQMLPSLTIQMPHAQLADTGLKAQWMLYAQLTEAGQQPAILDSRELLRSPGAVLSKLCRHLDIPYTDDMLHWPAGPRSEDGVWGPHWYHAVHRSTGFSEYVGKDGFPARLEALLDECRPWYDKLYAHAIRADNGD